MSGFFILMTKCASRQRSLISCPHNYASLSLPGGDTSCLSPSSELVTVVGRPGLYDFIPADVIIAQLTVMVPQGPRKLQWMGEEASRTVSCATWVLCLSHQQAAGFE